MKSQHQIHEMRSMRFHLIVVEQYRLAPDHVIQFGLENLNRWQQSGVECDDFKIWEQILRFTPQRLPEILSSLSEEAVRLRQSSPFAGLIPEESRQMILATLQ